MTWNSSRLWTLIIIILQTLSLGALASDVAPNEPVNSQNVPRALTLFSDSTPMLNGLQVKSGTAILDVRALRDDVIRVRIGPNGNLPEDASWAVLPDAHQSSVKVTAEDSADSVGFRTQSLRVKIGRRDLRLFGEPGARATGASAF